MTDSHRVDIKIQRDLVFKWIEVAFLILLQQRAKCKRQNELQKVWIKQVKQVKQVIFYKEPFKMTVSIKAFSCFYLCAY